MTRRLLAGLALLALTACGPPQPLEPAPTTSAAPSRYGAPPVERPRDVRAIAGDPCRTILDASAWQQLGFSPAGAGRTVVTGEQSCQWNRPASTETVGVIVIPGRDTLVAEYRVRQFPIFRPIEIAGLPAVAEQSSTDSTICTITVGTAEGQGLMTDYYASGAYRDDPCGRAQQITERIVQQLPPLQAK